MIRRLPARTKRLFDTKRLFKSATQSTDPDFRIGYRRNAIVIGTSVPYADKHLQTTKGDYTHTFRFGPQEKQRLIERVKKPDEARVAKIRKLRYIRNFDGDMITTSAGTGRKRMSDKEYNKRLYNARSFYVLWNWAEKRYPITCNIPKRTWFRQMPEEVKTAIIIMVKFDLLAGMRQR